MRDGYLRGTLPRTPTARQVDVLAAFVATGGSVADAAALVGVRPSTAKRHLADLRARSGLATEQLIYRGRAEGWLVVPALEPLSWPGSPSGHVSNRLATPKAVVAPGSPAFAPRRQVRPSLRPAAEDAPAGARKERRDGGP